MVAPSDWTLIIYETIKKAEFFHKQVRLGGLRISKLVEYDPNNVFSKLYHADGGIDDQ